MTEDWYERRLLDRIAQVYPGAEEAEEQVLREILETGCLSQNAANILAARRLIRLLPVPWAEAHIPKAAPRYLFQEREWQEWEFRRMAEMLRKQFPKAFVWLVDYARSLRNPEVDEAVSDVLEYPE